MNSVVRNNSCTYARLPHFVISLSLNLGTGCIVTLMHRFHAYLGKGLIRQHPFSIQFDEDFKETEGLVDISTIDLDKEPAIKQKDE